MKKYLVVCRQNKMRSPMVARYLNRLLKKKGIEAIAKSAGLLDSSPTKVTEEMVSDAEIIFVMDEDISNELLKDYGVNKDKIVNLNILDVYWGNKFNKYGLELELCYRSEQEKKEILGRPEILGKWNLKRVLEERNLSQYIK